MFTDDQVIFECNGMYTTESMALPLDVLHTSDKRRFREEVHHGAFKSKMPSADIMEFLVEFSKRELSHPADALNAMRGIFRWFSRLKPLSTTSRGFRLYQLGHSHLSRSTLSSKDFLGITKPLESDVPSSHCGLGPVGPSS
jgi:hypothetical protein